MKIVLVRATWNEGHKIEEVLGQEKVKRKARSKQILLIHHLYISRRHILISWQHLKRTMINNFWNLNQSSSTIKTTPEFLNKARKLLELSSVTVQREIALTLILIKQKKNMKIYIWMICCLIKVLFTSKVWVKLLMEIHWLERKSRLVPAHCRDMDKLQNNWNRPQKIQN